MLKKLALSAATGLLLWISWPEGGWTPLIFVALIPLLQLEWEIHSDGRGRKNLRLFGYSFLAIGIWHLLTIYWLKNASWIGVIAAIIINGILLSLAMLFFRYVKLKLGEQRGYVSLPFFWICAEAIHNYWEFNFPWLNLGNVFAERIEWVQWYEYTGIYGGTLWIWAVNLLLFYAYKRYLKHRSYAKVARQIAFTALPFILIPILASLYRYSRYQPQGKPAEIVVVQPNVDTYTEKFRMSDREQAELFVDLASPLLSDTTNFAIGPETMLPGGILESRIEDDGAVYQIRRLARKYPQTAMVFGATTRKYYKSGQQTETARPYSSRGGYYDAYNTAVLVKHNVLTEVYHKSKLVAGVEILPYKRYLEPVLGDLVHDMGGISGTLARQKEREVFTGRQGKLKAAPVICWEADFGDYVAEYVRKGANLIFIITNDDWWGNTQGHRQHMHYARLRAVENRRSIARSANTGISCFINQRGDVIKPQPYKTRAAIKHTIYANEEKTYYSKAGDVIVRVSVFIALFLLMFAVVRSYLVRNNSKI